MKKTSITLAVTLAAGFTLANQAHAAGGHYVVEDALLVDPSGCELESWHSRLDRNNADTALLLTCNPTGAFDIGGGLVRTEENGEYDTLVELNGKFLFRDAAEHRFGLGLAAIATYSNDSAKLETVELLLPATFNATDSLAIHANVGHANERNDANAGLWGVGIDLAVHQQVSLIAESFGTDRSGSTFHQAGCALHSAQSSWMSVTAVAPRTAISTRLPVALSWHSEHSLNPGRKPPRNLGSAMLV
ncbi:MAG: hypothetical protein LAT61_13365 [Alcanivorax sp.]|nr:hypothetical protein [Alcanivorax sp.]